MSDSNSRLMGRRSVLLAGAASALAAPAFLRAQTRAADKIKYSLDFRVYGETAPSLYGLDLGFFEKQGIDVTAMDGSTGSVDSITRVASGQYDFGVADMNSLVEFGSRNRGMAPYFICGMFDKSASALVSMKSKNIRKLSDLEGRKLGVSNSDAGARILPVILKLNGVDESKIEKVVIEPRLRNTMMVKGEVDAVISQNYTAIFDVLQIGVKQEDMNIINYADHGFDTYAQGLIASRKHVEQNPDLVRRVALAFVQSWLAARKDPAAAVQSAFKRNNLISTSAETARLQWLFENIIVTPNTMKNGIGTIDEARLTRAIQTLATGFNLPYVPKTSEIFDSRFMPSMQERRIV